MCVYCSVVLTVVVDTDSPPRTNVAASVVQGLLSHRRLDLNPKKSVSDDDAPMSLSFWLTETRSLTAFSSSCACVSSSWICSSCSGAIVIVTPNQILIQAAPFLHLFHRQHSKRNLLQILLEPKTLSNIIILTVVNSKADKAAEAEQPRVEVNHDEASPNIPPPPLDDHRRLSGKQHEQPMKIPKTPEEIIRESHKRWAQRRRRELAEAARDNNDPSPPQPETRLSVLRRLIHEEMEKQEEWKRVNRTRDPGIPGDARRQIRREKESVTKLEELRNEFAAEMRKEYK